MGHVANIRICYVLYRFVLPIVLLAATVVRYNFFSLIYGCLMLISPLLEHPSPKTLKSHTGRFITACLVLTSITVLSQIVFQLFLVIYVARGNDINLVLANCSDLENALRHIGLQRVQDVEPLFIVQTVLPDILAFVISLVVFVCCRTLRLSRLQKNGTSARISAFLSASIRGRPVLKADRAFWDMLGSVAMVVVTAACGIVHPSLLSSVFFIVTLVVMTLWAAHVCDGRSNRRVWQWLRLALLVYTAAYLVLIYVTQFHFAHEHLWIAEHLASGSTVERILGLSHFIQFDCALPWKTILRGDVKITEFINVVVLLLLYFILSYEIRTWRVTAMKRRIFVSQEHNSRQVQTSEGRQQVLLQKPFRDGVRSVSGADISDAGSIIPDMSLYGPSDIDGEIGSGCGVPAASGPKERSIMHSISAYVMRQSYIGMLIVMMIWSITYHSWLTFVFLLAACCLWIMPQKQRRCLQWSPVIVFYAEALLILQYIYGFNLTSSELPHSVPESGHRMDEIGIAKYVYPAKDLGIKLGYTFMFWLTLRHFSKTCRDKSQGRSNDIHMNSFALGAIRDLAVPGQYDGELIKDIGHWLSELLTKYWLFVCAALFLVIAMQEPVIFHIVYMLLFLGFVFVLKISFKFWRLCTNVFLWLVIIYSMLILICIYTYQFDDIRYLWLNKTGLSTQELKNIGLKKFSTASLFVELLTPASFVTFIIIQLHCFQKDFLIMSNIQRCTRNVEVDGDVEPADGTSVGTQIVLRQKSTSSRVFAERRQGVSNMTWKQRLFLRVLYLWRRLNHYCGKLSIVLWRALEVHMFKVVVFTVFACCISEVCATNIPPVLFVVTMMPFNRMHHSMSILCLIWASVVILLKMIFHLDIVPSTIMDSNCTRVYNEYIANGTAWSDINSSMVSNGTPDFELIERYSTWAMSNSAVYFGLQHTLNMAKHLAGYVAVVLVIALESIVQYHQKQFHNKETASPLRPGVIFGSVTRQEADGGLLKCIKFFINYGFYKFGKEMCFTMTMITMVVRLDVYSLVYGFFLGILLLLNRRRCSAFWPFYMILLMLILFVEYLFCLGLPPNICWEYPWDDMVLKLKSYLYLPDDVPHYVYSPAPKKLLVDFFQFLFVCLQWHVFHLENGDPKKLELFGGGSNASIFKDLRLKKDNPYDDFMSCKKSYMDYIKAGVFFYSYWFTLMIVFITGTARISLFCMGYLLGCFICLWFGEDMLIKPLKNLVKMWIGLLIYCYLVILAKCVLQLIGCVFLNVSTSNCWIIQLFNIVCLHSSQNKEGVNEHVVDDVGLLWDAICFVFLLLMLRVCKSWYFQHVFTELQLNSELSSFGADMINKNLFDLLRVQKEKEQEIVQKIKTKMDKIKERHLHFQPPGYKEPTDHYEVIRSGDKYMFEELSDDEDLDFSNEHQPVVLSPNDVVDHGTDNRSDWRQERHTVGPIKLINAALFGGTKEALNLCSTGRASSFSHRRQSGSSGAGISTPEPQSMGQGPSFTDGQVLYDSDLLSVGDLSPIRQSDLQLEEIEIMTPKEESVTIVSEDSVDRTEPASPPKSLPLPLSSPIQSCELRLRSGDKLSPRRTTPAIVNSDSLPAVAEELPNEATDVFIETEMLSLVTSVEAMETNVEDKEGEGAPGEVPCAPAVNGLKVAWAFFVSVVDWSTGQLFSISREYRDVSTILERHKLERKLNKQSCDPLNIEHITEEARAALELQYEKCRSERQTAEKEFHSNVHPILLFFIAFGEALVSHSAVLCYFAMILNTLMSGSIMSLLFPISIFFWSMLSIPRPTKRYWVTIITYTEVIIIVKYFFQFSCIWWLDGDEQSEEPLWLPRLIGIERRDMYAAYDFFLLFCLFLHRMVLKSHGLWKDGKNWTATVEPTSPFTQTPPVLEMKKNADQTKEPVLEEQSRRERWCAPVCDFFHHMIEPKYIASRDVYAPMFFCDLITFLIVVFGYASFGPSAAGGTDVATVIKQNRVPFPFLAMLLVQFVLIIVDRALYLRKQVIGKFVFHIFLVILVHIWMFLVLPYITERDFTNNVAAQMWYFTKCIYFALSCYQIRTGYPTRIVGNFLTKNYNYFTLVLFKGFLAVPFLLELRALMDWMWTDTTLGISSWLQMEDIYANIFVLKCARWAEKEWPTPRGQPRRALTKYGLGGVVLFLLIFVIWFPLLLFSLSSSIYTPCPPVSVSISIKIGGYEPLISLSSQDQHIYQITHEDFRHLKSIYAKQSDSRGLAYLNAHSEEDIYHVNVFGSSASIWEISNPSQMQLRDDLIGNGSKIAITCAIAFSREPREGLTETVSEKFERFLDHSKEDDHKIMMLLAGIINGTEVKSVTISELFPRYLTVPSKGKVNQSVALYSKGLKYSSVLLTLHHDRQRMTKWWAVQEVIRDKLLDHEINKADTEVVRNFLTFISFNERVPTGVLSLFDKYGIIGLYVSVILVIGRFVRLQTVGNFKNVMFFELPYVDRIHGICRDLYLVRQAGELALEEMLFSKLLFLYRSPETLIQWTRLPKEKVD